MENSPKPLSQCKLVYAGDARNNVANSLMIGAAKVGMDFTAVAPPELHPDKALVDEMRSIAAESGSKIEITSDIASGLKGADAVYTDVWVSMGEEDMFEERIKLLQPYRVDMNMMKASENPDVIFLHCLPSFHDTETAVGREVAEKYGISEMEVTDEVFRSPFSKVFDEAENRMHTIKAVMVATIGNL